MFYGYIFAKSDGQWDIYNMYDSEFHTTFSVIRVGNDLEYFSDMYYNMYTIYCSRKLNAKSFISQLFMYEYEYSIDKRAIDISQTSFFTEHDWVKKVMLLL